MKFLYYFIRVVFALFLLAFAIFILFWVSHSWKNPIQVLMRKSAQPVLVEERAYTVSEQPDRIYTDVLLNCKKAGFARFTISSPKKMPSKGLPCILLAVGLDTSRESLRHISDQEGYIFVAYEYPPVLKKLKKSFLLFSLRNIRENVFNVPAQLVSIVQWMQQKSLCCENFVAVVGISFGSFFLPATYHLAQKEAIELGPAVIGYGGADLYHIFYAQIKGPKFFRTTVARIAAILFRPIEPLLHIPYMRKGHFLIINGECDEKIPVISAEKLQQKIPEEKTILNLKTQHLDPTNHRLIEKLVELSKNWIEETLSVQAKNCRSEK